MADTANLFRISSFRRFSFQRACKGYPLRPGSTTQRRIKIRIKKKGRVVRDTDTERDNCSTEISNSEFKKEKQWHGSLNQLCNVGKSQRSLVDLDLKMRHLPNWWFPFMNNFLSNETQYLCSMPVGRNSGHCFFASLLVF